MSTEEGIASGFLPAKIMLGVFGRNLASWRKKECTAGICSDAACHAWFFAGRGAAQVACLGQ
jgi:hypothetical protein